MKKLLFILSCSLYIVYCFAGSELWDCKTTCKNPKYKDAMECEHCYPARID